MNSKYWTHEDWKEFSAFFFGLGMQQRMDKIKGEWTYKIRQALEEIASGERTTLDAPADKFRGGLREGGTDPKNSSHATAGKKETIRNQQALAEKFLKMMHFKK